MCLVVLGMHGEVEEVWSGGSACWFDRSLVPGDSIPGNVWAQANLGRNGEPSHQAVDGRCSQGETCNLCE